jgi:predicted RND superfamily exporter protein
MDISVEIKMIQEELDSVQDEHLINAIKSILAFAKSKNDGTIFESFSIADYQKRAEQSEEDIRMGRFVNIDD